MRKEKEGGRRERGDEREGSERERESECVCVRERESMVFFKLNCRSWTKLP